MSQDKPWRLYIKARSKKLQEKPLDIQFNSQDIFGYMLLPKESWLRYMNFSKSGRVVLLSSHRKPCLSFPSPCTHCCDQGWSNITNCSNRKVGQKGSNVPKEKILTMIWKGRVAGVVDMEGVGANWEVLKRTSIEHPIAVHVIGAWGPPVSRRTGSMTLNMPLGSLGFLWSRFLRGSYRWRPGKTSNTTTALLQMHALPSPSPSQHTNLS